MTPQTPTLRRLTGTPRATLAVLAAVGLALGASACERGGPPASPDGAEIAASGGDQEESGDQVPQFDFSDAFYRDNGIDPDAILRRVGTEDRDTTIWTVDETTDPTRRDIRILEHTGGWDASGNLIYYTVQGMVGPETFTDDELGEEARQIADQFRAFIFPKTQDDGSVVLSPAPPNRRQDNIFDTEGGYFSNNPLGLWRLVFVVYTDEAFESKTCQDEMEKLAEDNGRDLDGTPIIQTKSTIEKLQSDGCVELLKRDADGSQGFPWVI